MDIAGNIRNVAKFSLAPDVDAQALRFATVCKMAGYSSVRLCIDMGEITMLNIYDSADRLHSLANLGGAWCERVD